MKKRGKENSERFEDTCRRYLLKHVEEEDTVRRFKNISGSSEAQYF
jgi:hypothetical protein